MGTRGKKKAPVKLIVGLVILAIVLGAVLAGVLYVKDVIDDLNGEHRTETMITVTVEKGDTLISVAKKLGEAGVVKYPTVFRIFCSMKTSDTIHVGTHQFAVGQKYEEIFKALQKAPTYRPTVRITFTEGMEVSDVIDRFLEKGLEAGALWTRSGFESAKAHKYDFDYLPDVTVANRLEGFLYPDTYEFFVDSTEVELFTKMIMNFNQKAVSSGLQAKAAAKGMSLYDALTLGSIIQKEAGKVADFNMVSSVFHNRLRDDWLLQSDAAVSYPIPKEERLPSCTYEQLKTDTPYNVYMHKGLTPTPICNPSIEAAIAACEPSESEYFYFIGYVDKTTGEQITVFAKTLAEHQTNINKYLK